MVLPYMVLPYMEASAGVCDCEQVNEDTMITQQTGY